MLGRGKTTGEASTLSFEGGRFRSSACDRYGDGAYDPTASAGVITFDTESPKYGKLLWRAMVGEASTDSRPASG